MPGSETPKSFVVTSWLLTIFIASSCAKIGLAVKSIPKANIKKILLFFFIFSNLKLLTYNFLLISLNHLGLIVTLDARQSLGFNLPDSLAGYAEFLSNLFQGMSYSIL